jgi:hypothetical protein
LDLFAPGIVSTGWDRTPLQVSHQMDMMLGIEVEDVVFIRQLMNPNDYHPQVIQASGLAFKRNLVGLYPESDHEALGHTDGIHGDDAPLCD